MLIPCQELSRDQTRMELSEDAVTKDPGGRREGENRMELREEEEEEEMNSDRD